MSQDISKPVESWELSALCLGELDNTRAAEVRHAMSLSPDLQSEYDRLSDTISTLRSSMNELFAIPSISEVNVDAPPTALDITLAASQRDTVLAAAAKHAQHTSEQAEVETVTKVTLNHSNHSRQTLWPLLAVVAASIAIVLGLSPIYLRRNQSSNTENKIAQAANGEQSGPVQNNEVSAIDDVAFESPQIKEENLSDLTVAPQKGISDRGRAATSDNEKQELPPVNKSLADSGGTMDSTTDSLATTVNSADTATLEIMSSKATVVRRGPSSTIERSASSQPNESRELAEAIVQAQTTPSPGKPAAVGGAISGFRSSGGPISGYGSSVEAKSSDSNTKENSNPALSARSDEYRKKLDSQYDRSRGIQAPPNTPSEKGKLELSASAGASPASPVAPTTNFYDNTELRKRSFGVNPPSDATDGKAKTSPYGAWGAMGTRDTSDNWNEEMRLERRLGRDPTATGDRFAAFVPNPWYSPTKDPLSTVSIDVDTASYAKVRQLLNESEQLPAPGSVRIEEFVNYFDYNYAAPQDDQPFSAALAVGPCPWNSENRLVRIAIQAKKVDMKERESANVVLLIDVSGSMNQPNKLPLVKRTVQTFVRQMRANDRIAIVVYAGAAGLVLPSTSGREQSTILDAIERLSAGGSTNGGQGIQLAYTIARENFVPNGINRVVLCTDGDFNVGVTGDDALVALVKENAKSKVFLTCLGFGVGNFNDSMMEKISNEGNGVYGFVDNDREARRWMCEKLDSSLVTIAKDVKLQIEFNPSTVGNYRLIGYENRILKHEDFNNDRKDAGDVNAGHRVTAFYEIVPPGRSPTVPEVDPLRYTSGTNKPVSPTPEESKTAENDLQSGTIQPFVSDELLTLKIRYKKPEGDVSTKVEFPLKGATNGAEAGDADFEWASHVALFATMLRDPNAFTQTQWKQLVEKVDAMLAGTKDADREEFGSMVRKAYRLVDAMAPRWDPKSME